MRADVIVVSDGDKHFASALDEYTKRLSSFVTMHVLKPIKYGTPEQIIQKESQMLVDKLNHLTQKSDAKVVLLSHRGTSEESHQFAQRHRNGQSVFYVVGGAYGVDESVLKPYIDARVSFGHQTMPHGLVKLVLMEQLRRTHTILINKKYHY